MIGGGAVCVKLFSAEQQDTFGCMQDIACHHSLSSHTESRKQGRTNLTLHLSK